jgi:hypothetical protein
MMKLPLSDSSVHMEEFVLLFIGGLFVIAALAVAALVVLAPRTKLARDVQPYALRTFAVTGSLGLLMLVAAAVVAVLLV